MPKMFSTFFIIVKHMIFVNIYRKHLVELIMAIMVTPTSANTAVHIFAIPNVPSTMTLPLLLVQRLYFAIVFY